MHRHALVFSILAITQIVGWGTVGFLAVAAAGIAHSLGVDLPVVFMGTSVMFVTMGLAAPVAGAGFRRLGARRVMSAGAACMAIGLGLIAAAPVLSVFLAGFAVTGLGGAMFLTTAAYAYLAAYADDRARGFIGTLMLVTGLAGSVFWPATAYLYSQLGWRGAVFVYAAIMAAIVAPLVLFALPEPGPANDAPGADPPKTRGMDRAFLLIVLVVALNSFVTFGIEAVGIELLRAMGADIARAVAIASLLGFFKVGGRIVDLAGGRRWDGLSTAILSGAAIPLGLVALAAWGSGFPAVACYLGLFGVGSGAFAVARATMPLVFYRKADYATAMSAIALPMNLVNALAPPALAAMLVAVGPKPVLLSLSLVSGAAFVLLLVLARLRPAPAGTLL